MYRCTVQLCFVPTRLAMLKLKHCHQANCPVSYLKKWHSPMCMHIYLHTGTPITLLLDSWSCHGPTTLNTSIQEYKSRCWFVLEYPRKRLNWHNYSTYTAFVYGRDLSNGFLTKFCVSRLTIISFDDEGIFFDVQFFNVSTFIKCYPNINVTFFLRISMTLFSWYFKIWYTNTRC